MLGDVVGGAAVSPHPNSAEDNTAWIYRIVGVPRPASSSSTMKVTTWSWRSRSNGRAPRAGISSYASHPHWARRSAEIPLTVLAVVKEGAVPRQTCTWEMGLDPGGRTLGRQARPPGRTARTGSGLACSCDVVADGSLLVLG